MICWPTCRLPESQGLDDHGFERETGLTHYEPEISGGFYGCSEGFSFQFKYVADILSKF